MNRPTLRGPRVLLRPPADADLDALAAALAEPAVARYWPGYDRERIRHEIIEADDELAVLAIEHEGQVAGIIQYSEETDPQYRHVGVDLFLASRWHGRGLGTEAIRLVLVHAFDTLGHHRAVIDPAAGNVQAIRAYERVGFRRVGVMRQYERGADGTWHDGLLMELLAGELRRE